MRVALPVTEDRGMYSEVAPHFGHVPLVAVYDTGTGKLDMVRVKPTEGCSPIDSLEGKRIDAVYAFGMGMRAMERCRQQGIKILTGEFVTVREVADNLDSLRELREDCGH